MPAIKEGGKAPSFILQDGAGKRVALDDFKGRDAAAHPAEVFEAIRGRTA